MRDIKYQPIYTYKGKSLIFNLKNVDKCRKFLFDKFNTRTNGIIYGKRRCGKGMIARDYALFYHNHQRNLIYRPNASTPFLEDDRINLAAPVIYYQPFTKFNYKSFVNIAGQDILYWTFQKTQGYDSRNTTNESKESLIELINRHGCCQIIIDDLLSGTNYQISKFLDFTKKLRNVSIILVEHQEKLEPLLYELDGFGTKFHYSLLDYNDTKQIIKEWSEFHWGENHVYFTWDDFEIQLAHYKSEGYAGVLVDLLENSLFKIKHDNLGFNIEKDCAILKQKIINSLNKAYDYYNLVTPLYFE